MRKATQASAHPRPEEKRVAPAVAVERLHHVIPRVERERVKVDHLYDY
jgi:hypothetical protein